jgi:uncharacterized membrane protein
MARTGPQQDARMDQIIGNLLRIGVLVAVVVVSAGGILYLTLHGAEMPDYKVFRGEPADLRSLSGIAKGAWSLHINGVIQFGILLLMATPVARVAVAVIGFAIQRDRTYVVVALIVLAVLIYSFFGGNL